MQKIHYIGEHLLIGHIGNVFVLLSFVGALLAAICYFLAEKNELEKASWIKTARIAFRLHSLGVIGIIVTLFTMIFNHYYEYYYVWEHSNNIMPMRYVLSCFWEGQEGSFLLWTFWQVVLGNILIYTAKNWESSVMTVIALVQTFLASMLLGFYFHGIHIGSNPFTSLLRENSQFANIPLFQEPNYLQHLDGRGLNPLLQNYWMTIHPPTLFLGFASTVVPFAFAIAGLWRKKLGEWQAQALPWVFFGVMVLGTGILMGGAWAYESLSFGGFWAWDPVENASLVPWLILVGTGHILIIYKNKKQSLLSTFLLPILTFLLVLYSTFLTRSGILGKTSVHSFPDFGLSGQLLIYLLFFVWLSALLLMQNKNLRFYYTVACAFLLAVGATFNFSVYSFNVKIIALLVFILLSIVMMLVGLAKYFPKETEEEAIWSREFWMFIGALVLLVSCFQILTTTSIPVTNKLFHMNKAEPANRIEHYNMWQVPFAILVTLLVGVGQYFKYKETEMKLFLKKISPSFFLSLAISLSAIFYLHVTNVFFGVLLFSAVFAALANLDYFIHAFHGKIPKAGSSIAHIGFAMIILGALISTSQQQCISENTSGKSVTSLGKGYSDNSNILMTVGDTLKMGNYYVTYTGKDKKGVNIKYHVKYFTKENGKYVLAFTLDPIIQLNPQMGNVAEPSTKRFLTRDIYTHITFADLDDMNAPVSTGEYNDPKKSTVALGDTMFSSNALIVLDSIDTHVDKKKYDLSDSDIVLGAKLKIYDFNKNVYYAEPLYIIKNGYLQVSDDTVPKLGLKFRFENVNTETGKIDISISEKKSVAKDYIVMTAIVFPFINVLWMGCIIMVIGTILAIRARLKSNKQKK